MNVEDREEEGEDIQEVDISRSNWEVAGCAEHVAILMKKLSPIVSSK